MAEIQCPICKNEFEIQLDISVKTKGLTVFRGSMGFLGDLGDLEALREFIRSTFRESPRLPKRVLIDRLVVNAGIPHSDACHFVEKLQEEGFVYQPNGHELAFIG